MRQILKNIFKLLRNHSANKNPNNPSVYATAAKALMLVTVIALLSCQSENGGSVEAQKLQATVVAHEEPNRYHVDLSWPKNDDAMGWQVARAGRKESGPVTIATIEKGQQQFVDNKVTAGEEYRYQIIAVELGRYRIAGETLVNVPRDVEIKGVSDLRELTQLNRLFLRAQSKILTNGEDLVIHAKEIISEGSTIETFPIYQTAKPGVDGRNGGNIWIAAQTGRGLLEIYSRGENGGRFVVPAANQDGPANVCRGGDSARVYVQINDASHMQIKPHADIGVGGSGPSTNVTGTGGALLATCLRLSGATLGDCESFKY